MEILHLCDSKYQDENEYKIILTVNCNYNIKIKTFGLLPEYLKSANQKYPPPRFIKIRGILWVFHLSLSWLMVGKASMIKIQVWS